MTPMLLEFKFLIIAGLNLMNFKWRNSFHMLPHILLTPRYQAYFRLVLRTS